MRPHESMNFKGDTPQVSTVREVRALMQCRLRVHCVVAETDQLSTSDNVYIIQLFIDNC